MSSIEPIINQLVKTHLGIETLETRNADSLDFHDIAVWRLRAALEAAFQAGLEQGCNAHQIECESGR